MPASAEIIQDNIAFFNGPGRDVMQSDEVKPLAAKSADAIRGAVKLTPETVALDFACGAGKIAAELIQDCKSILGLDISSGPVEDFNTLASSLDVSDRLFAECVDITENPAILDGQAFDLIFCVLSYHHFPSPDLITKALTKVLKPSGNFVIIDWIKTDKRDGGPGEIATRLGNAIPHANGYTEQEVGEIYTSGGLKMVHFAQAFEYELFDNNFNTFVAVGTK